MQKDPKLGAQVFEHLKGLKLLGAQTTSYSLTANKTQALPFIEAKMSDVLDQLGLDVQDESISDTPRRVAKMYVNELFTGLDSENFPKCTTTENNFKTNEMVLESGITVHSLCEHHFQAIIGTATVAYIPKDKLLGLSKLNRVVHFFARRPQVQERLTMQIYEALKFILGTDDIAVVVKAAHMCVKLRGVQDNDCLTATSKMGGKFMDNPSLRSEFLSLSR